MEHEPSTSETPATEVSIGRNEPCPCGSGKKYKRCHGVGAAPKLGPPAMARADSGDGQTPAMPAMPGGFDPSQLDPQSMAKVAQAMRRLPKAQMQRLQSLVQKAMAGKDVSREAAELEGALPPDFQNLMLSLAPGMMGGGTQPAAPMTEEDARRIVAEAAVKGEVDEAKAEALLGEKPADVASKPKGWKSFFGKK